MPKPVTKGKKPKLHGKKDKLTSQDVTDLKTKLKGHGMSQAEVDAIVRTDIDGETLVSSVTTIQRGYPKA